MTADELRNELGSLIWKTATNLVHGGKVSPVQFMDFMLGSLFYMKFYHCFPEILDAVSPKSAKVDAVSQ